MTQIKAVTQTILKYLESQNRQLQGLSKKVDNVQEQLKAIRPQTYLHPIPKPRQGKEFSRSTSVAGWLFEAIKILNESIPCGQQNYMQFPDGIDFRRLNSDCIRELEGLLSFHIPDYCGKLTWEESCNKSPRDCENIIREAKALPELAVFAQAAGQWALRMLCANKMRTMIAQTKKNSGKTTAIDRATVNVAVNNYIEDSQVLSGAMTEMQDETGNGSLEHGRTADNEIQSQGDPEMVEEQVSDQEDENASQVHDDSLSIADEREYSGEEETDPTQDGEEVLSDFPHIQDQDFHQAQDDQSAQYRTLEIENNILIPASNQSGSSQGADPRRQTENIDSPAHIQAAAQKAASQMLLASPARSAFIHKTVFPDTNQRSHANGKPKSPACNKKALGGIKKKVLARTERSTGTNHRSKGQASKALSKEANQNTGRLTGRSRSQPNQKPARSRRTISVPENIRVPSIKRTAASHSKAPTQQKNGRVLQAERMKTVMLGTERGPSNKHSDLETTGADKSGLSQYESRSARSRPQQHGNVPLKRTSNMVRKNFSRSRETAKSPSRSSTHAVPKISSDLKAVNSRNQWHKRGR